MTEYVQHHARPELHTVTDKDEGVQRREEDADADGLQRRDSRDDVEANAAPKRSRRKWLIVAFVALLVALAAAVGGGVAGSRKHHGTTSNGTSSTGNTSSPSTIANTSTSSLSRQLVSFTLSVPATTVLAAPPLLSTVYSALLTAATLQPSLVTETLYSSQPPAVASGASPSPVATQTRVVTVYDGTVTVPEIGRAHV